MSEQDLINAAKAPTIAYNKKDWGGVKAAITADFVCEEIGTQRKFNGPDQVLEGWKGWAAAVPDSQASIDDAFVSGNKVVLEVTWRGKHTGPLQTPRGVIPATGKSIELRACQVLEVEGGKAKTMRHYFDMASFMQQLGLAG